MKFNVTQTAFNSERQQWYQMRIAQHFTFNPTTSNDKAMIGEVELNKIDDIVKFINVVDEAIVVDGNDIEIYNDYRE